MTFFLDSVAELYKIEFIGIVGERRRFNLSNQCFDDVIFYETDEYMITFFLFQTLLTAMAQVHCFYTRCPKGCGEKIHCVNDFHRTVCAKEVIQCIFGNCSERFERSNFYLHVKYCSAMPRPKLHNGTCPECLSNFACTKGLIITHI